MAAVSRGVRTAAARQQQRGGSGRAAALLARIARPAALLPPLPPPMVVDNYEANATSCHMQVRCQKGWCGRGGWGPPWPAGRQRGPRGACCARALTPAFSSHLLQEEFKDVIGDADGFAYEARAPQEATFVAQK